MASYSFEIYSSGGTQVADLSKLARSRAVKAERNGVEEITFDLDADALNTYASSLQTTSAGILGSGTNEVRVARTNNAGTKTYLCGGRIDYHKSVVSGPQKIISVTAHGFLSMFDDRIVEVQRTFSPTDYSTVLWTLINESQTGSVNIYTSPTPSNTDFGVTQGTLQTIGNITITYDLGKKLKDAIIEATQNNALPCDFSFSEAKVFNVWTRLGSDKPSIIVEYPGSVVRDSTEFDMDATGISNRVYTSGQGASSLDEDTSSEANYKVRQYYLQANQETSTTNLSNMGKAYYAATKDALLLGVPQVDLNGSLTIDQFWVGDRITVRNNDPAIPVPLSGLFRIEALDLKIDDNGMESAALTLRQ